jgi:preprotein translocase subunit SecG
LHSAHRFEQGFGGSAGLVDFGAGVSRGFGGFLSRFVSIFLLLVFIFHRLCPLSGFLGNL